MKSTLNVARPSEYLDEPWNAEKARDFPIDTPQFWVLVTPVECQALRDGVVSTAIQRQADRCLDSLVHVLPPKARARLKSTA